MVFVVSCIILDDYRTVTKCDGSKRSGSAIFVDFGKIGLPCTCIVTSSFIGELYVTSWKTTYVLCKNRVTVNKTVIVNCKDDGVEKFNVKINDTIIVKAEIQPGHTFEKFYQCLGFINYRKYIQIYIFRIRRDEVKSFPCFK